MKILDWEGIALIIGSGDIGTQLSKHLTSISPNLEVIVCGRTIKSINGIYLDLENSDSLLSFEESISAFRKPLRLVINTSGFLHSNIIKPEKNFYMLIILI